MTELFLSSGLRAFRLFGQGNLPEAAKRFAEEHDCSLSRFCMWAKEKLCHPSQLSPPPSTAAGPSTSAPTSATRDGLRSASKKAEDPSGSKTGVIVIPPSRGRGRGSRGRGGGERGKNGGTTSA